MKAAIMGFGTVGSGVYEVLDRNRETVRKKAGEPIEIKYILNRRDLPGSPVEDLVVHEIGTILEDPETGLVVETMGGTSPAYEYVKCCLQAGKHVVTSNKNLVAAHGTELLAIAREKRVSFLFEASVGGGIPIIRTINESLAGDVVEEISGILNGTTNYILTKMYEEGWGFDEALKMAQELGYAERNPEADIEGYDTCRKIAILTAAASGQEVDYEQIPTEGITKLTDVDFSYAARLGASIKLFGTSICRDGRYYLEVAPVFINARNPLYSVAECSTDPFKQQYAGRVHVLRQRSRKASHCQRCCGRHDRSGTAEGPSGGPGLDRAAAGGASGPSASLEIFCQV